MTELASYIWGDYNTDRIPSSGFKEPKKRLIREWGTWVEAGLLGTSVVGRVIHATRASLYADLAHAANTMAWVWDDPTAAYNGIYGKVGASGSGSWTRLTDLPYSFLAAQNDGDGTANAIEATTPAPIPDGNGRTLITLPIFATNTNTPVTVEFNADGAPLTIKTSAGNDPVPGGLVAGMIVAGWKDGSTFRMLSDQASAAIQAAAEDAADRAEAAAVGIAITTCATRTELKALDPTLRKLAVLREAGREGTFAWRTGDYSAQVAADTAEGIYIKADSVAATAGAWVRVYDGPVLVTWFGVSAASADNTAAYDALAAIVPSGAALIFPRSQTFLGHFVTGKSYRVDLNGSTLVNVSDTTAILQLGAVTPTAHNVTEATLAHGDRSFTVTGASGLFAAGEIGYLWDSAVRPSDSQPVNYECVRIASVAGDVVTVEGFLRSHKGAGAIKFYHSADQIKNAAIVNGFAAPTSSHTWPVFSIWNCHGAMARDLDVTGGRGNAVSLRNSYDVEIDNTALRNPSGTGSGEGYGAAVLTCTKVRASNIYGDGARHAYDQDSTYDFEIDGVTDWSPASAPCIIAHNGFAAYGTVQNVRTRVADYAITYSAQGFGTGGGNALRQNHPARDVYIAGCKHVVPSTMDANTSFTSIYIQTDVSGGVRDCTLRFENSTAVSNTSPSRLLRVTGAMVGEYHVENLDANRVGSLVFMDNYANGPAGVGACFIRNLRCPETRIPVWLRGDWGVDVDGLWLGTVAGDQLVLMDTLNGDAPLFAAVGASIRYSGTDREIIRTSQATTGTKAPIARLSSSSVSVVAGDAISLVNVQNRDAMFTLVTPTGAGTCTLSATDALPAPQINGAELYIRTVSGRNDAAFPAGNNITGGFTLTAGGAARLVAYGGKWVATVY